MNVMNEWMDGGLSQQSVIMNKVEVNSNPHLENDRDWMTDS